MYQPTDDTDWLLHELGGKHRAQVLSTLAAIGLPDQLQQLGSANVAQLAKALGSDLGDLESLMRAATGLGCLQEEPPGTFALTTRGRLLCRDSLGAFAACLGSKSQWDPWARFRDSLRDAAGVERSLCLVEKDAHIGPFVLFARLGLDGRSHAIGRGRAPIEPIARIPRFARAMRARVNSRLG